MKGDPQVLQHLNSVLANELIAINQYFLHSRMYNDWGLNELGEFDYKHSIKAMKRADDIIERVLFLEGLPNLQDLGKLRVGENTAEMLKCDLDLEMDSLTLLRSVVVYCESVSDYVTRDLLREIIDAEEQHVDDLETELDLMSKVGIKNYLQSKMDD